MTADEQKYGWCFDHAALHEGSWCTARCVPLAGSTRKAAMEDKAARFGAAMALFELAPDQQAAVIEQRQASQGSRT